MTNYTCPQCKGELKEVTNNSLFMNKDQFDAEKAGDFYCERCPGNDRGKQPRCYWWTSEVRKPDIRPEVIVEANKAIDKVRDIVKRLTQAEKDYLQKHSAEYLKLVDTIRKWYAKEA
jgi:hypothetical protein